MKLTLGQRLDALARNLAPLVLTLTLVMLGALPLPFPGIAHVVPLFGVVAIYHWAIFRPDLMGGVAVFGVGLVQDLLAGTTLGVGPLVLLLVRLMVMSQRRLFSAMSFVFAWCTFALIAGLAQGAAWALQSMSRGMPLDTRALVFQYLLTLAVYPFLSWIFARTQHALLR